MNLPTGSIDYEHHKETAGDAERSLHQCQFPKAVAQISKGLCSTTGQSHQTIRMRTREGMAIARAMGQLVGRQPKFSTLQRWHLMSLHDKGKHSQAELADWGLLHG